MVVSLRLGIAQAALSMAALLVPVAGYAASSVTCALSEGCGTEDCGADAELAATLEAIGEVWKMTSNGQIAGSFREIAETGGAQHFVSTDIDPAAGAAALLTIFENGEAMLSVHGTFVSPMGQTYGGFCTTETG